MIRTLALIALAAASAAAAAPIDDVAASLKSTTAFSATFSQTGPDGHVETGRMTIARPGKIRFQYDHAPKLIVADGKTLTMVDYEVSQVSRWPVRSSPLGILLSSEPDLSKLAKVIGESASGLLVEARDRSHPEFGTLSITFNRDAKAPGGLAIGGWTVKDAQGGITEFRLTNPRYNADVEKTDFGFKDPRQRTPGRIN